MDEDFALLEEVLTSWGITPPPAPTFSLSDEGGGIRALYLSGVSARRVGAWLAPLAADAQLAALSGLAPREAVAQLPWGGWLGSGSLIRDLRPPAGGPLGFEPVEIALVDAELTPADVADRAPPSLMAWPERAVPAGFRAAVVLPDDDHAIVYARDPAVHRACLRGLIDDAALDAYGEIPECPATALDGLLTPSPEGASRRVAIRARSRYRQLDLAACAADLREPDGSNDETWVAALGGSWRAGWAW